MAHATTWPIALALAGAGLLIGTIAPAQAQVLGTNTIAARFDAASGVLSITGNIFNNSITVSRDNAGTILVNDGLVNVLGGAPTVSGTRLIQVSGSGGNDQLALDGRNGGLPRAILLGGDGDDRLIWTHPAGSNTAEGGNGADTVEVNGTNLSEAFSVTANGTRVRFDRTRPYPVSMDIGSSESLVVNANGGNDTFTAVGNLAALIRITADGGSGDDTLSGSNGPDVLLGGDGNDTIDGGQDNDLILLGQGDDNFTWAPGDGSDTIEGQAGIDGLRFNGSSGHELISLSANGPRLLLTRNLGNIVLDADGVEHTDISALGGADTITISDLTGTAGSLVSVSLTGAPGSSTDDGQRDVVVVNATKGDDAVVVSSATDAVRVEGLRPTISIAGASATQDALLVNGLAGNDRLNAARLGAVIDLTLDGGLGDDVIRGGAGDDLLLGGPGTDTADGGPGTDSATDAEVVRSVP